jgi:hypothetical protein
MDRPLGNEDACCPADLGAERLAHAMLLSSELARYRSEIAMVEAGKND